MTKTRSAGSKREAHYLWTVNKGLAPCRASSINCSAAVVLLLKLAGFHNQSPLLSVGKLYTISITNVVAPMHTKREKASFPVPVSVRRSKTPYPSVSTKIACEQALRSLFWPPATRASQRVCSQANTKKKSRRIFCVFFFLLAFLAKYYLSTSWTCKIPFFKQVIIENLWLPNEVNCLVGDQTRWGNWWSMWKSNFPKIRVQNIEVPNATKRIGLKFHFVCFVTVSAPFRRGHNFLTKIEINDYLARFTSLIWCWSYCIWFESHGLLYPMMAYTGRLRPNGVSFSGFRCKKG